MNKKGYLRTIEAVIAIVIILAFTYTVTPKPTFEDDAVPYSVEVAQETILRTITDTPVARDNVLTEPISEPETKYEPSDITSFFYATIEDDMPPGYDYAMAICVDPGCISDSIRDLEKSVYMDDVVITSGDETRIIRIWMWPRG